MKDEEYLLSAVKQYEEHLRTGEAFYMDAPVLMDIHEYYLKKEREYDAEQVLRYAEKTFPDNEEVKIVRAYVLKGKGLWNDALRKVKDISNENMRDVHLLNAEFLVAGGNPDEAQKCIEQLMPEPLTDTDHDWYLDLAEIYMDYGYFQRALDNLQRIPDEYELVNRKYELIGDAWLQLGDYEQSVAAFNRIVDADPYDSTTWTQLAEIHQKYEHNDECLTCCNYALAIDPNNMRAANLRIFATFAEGNRKEGYDLCREYVTRFPDDYAIPMYIAEQLFAEKLINESHTAFQTALRLCPFGAPDRQRIVQGLAYVQCQLGFLDRSFETLSTQTLSGVQLNDIYQQAAVLYFENHRPEEACEKLRMLVHMPSVTETELATVIRLLVENGVYIKALDIWEILSVRYYSEQYYPLLAHIAMAFYKMQQSEQCYMMAQRAAAMSPDYFVQVFSSTFRAKSATEILQAIDEERKGWVSYDL